MERTSWKVGIMYRIIPPKKKICEQIGKLQPAYREKLREVFQDIENDPRRHPLGKITPFKGDLKYLGWHYDLSWGLRIHYNIYEDTKTIMITYIGSHPKY